MDSKAPEHVWICPQNYEAATACCHPSDTEYIRLDLHTAALAKQGSPPPNRDSLEAEQLAYEIISDLHSILGSKMDGHIREVRVKVQERIANEIVALSPPADTVERARELIDSCAVDGDVAPSGRLYVTVAHDTLARRISAALVEKDATIQRLHDEIAELAHTVATHSDKIVEQGRLNRMIEGVFGSQEDAVREKEREVWDKAIGIVSENFHVFGQDILPALEAARTSKKEK